MSKLAVITGVSGGFGLALAQEFAARGWRVAGTGRSKQPDDLPQGATYHQFDAGESSACETFWQTIHADHADAQVCLVNNAGGYVSGGLTATSPESFEQQMRSCYFTAVYMTRALAQGYSSGRIINIISASALAAQKNDSAYGAAKAAEMHFFQSLQQEFKPEQYQITNLYPSDIASSGERPNAIAPTDLAAFVREQAENSTSYYLRDVSLYPVK